MTIEAAVHIRNVNRGQRRRMTRQRRRKKRRKTRQGRRDAAASLGECGGARDGLRRDFQLFVGRMGWRGDQDMEVRLG